MSIKNFNCVRERNIAEEIVNGDQSYAELAIKYTTSKLVVGRIVEKLDFYLTCDSTVYNNKKIKKLKTKTFMTRSLKNL